MGIEGSVSLSHTNTYCIYSDLMIDLTSCRERERQRERDTERYRDTEIEIERRES